MYNTLKRLSSSTAIVTEYLFLNKIATGKVIASISLISVGALIAGYNDIEFHLQSYLWAGASCVLNATNLTLIKLVAPEPQTPHPEHPILKPKP